MKPSPIERRRKHLKRSEVSSEWRTPHSALVMISQNLLLLRDSQDECRRSSAFYDIVQITYSASTIPPNNSAAPLSTEELFLAKGAPLECLAAGPDDVMRPPGHSEHTNKNIPFH